jgi:hypothetical protein
VLPRFDGHLMIASSGAEGVRYDCKEPAEVHAEFKADAVEMVEAAGGNIAKVARELGI